MAKKLYQYTIYRQDGSIDVLEPCPKKDWPGAGGLYELLDCRTIQVVPSDYYREKKWGHALVMCDEEGSFKQGNIKNPHFTELAPGWYLVGDVVKEEVYHEAKNTTTGQLTGAAR